MDEAKCSRYLVRQAAPKNPAAPTPAEEISTGKLPITTLSLITKVSVQESTKIVTKKKAKIDIGVRVAKMTTKKLLAHTKKSVKISASKKTDCQNPKEWCHIYSKDCRKKGSSAEKDYQETYFQKNDSKTSIKSGY
jgi:hypothetical protein